jgi:hypothetical protein
LVVSLELRDYPSVTVVHQQERHLGHVRDESDAKPRQRCWAPRKPPIAWPGSTGLVSDKNLSARPTGAESPRPHPNLATRHLPAPKSAKHVNPGG